MNTDFPSRLALHLANRVHAARRRYRKRLARCQKKFSEKAVHELRVETRRMLALLDLLAALHFPASLKKTRKVFKKRLDAFDELRDTQVQLGLLKPLWRDFPEACDFKKLLRRCEERIVTKLARKIKATKSSRLNRRLKEIEKCLRRGPDGDDSGAGAVLPALEAAFQRVVTLRRQVRRSRTATIHRMRVAFKRFRYMSELLRPFLPGLTTETLDRMKEYQAMAGDIQDLEVLLGRLARHIEAGELNVGAIRNLRSELLRRRQRAIDSFMKRIDDLFQFQPAPAARKGFIST